MPTLTAGTAAALPTRLQRRRRLTPLDIAGRIDERLYDPRLSVDEFASGCRVAADSRVAAVVCPPSRVALAAYLLTGSGVRVSAAPTHIPFPADTLTLAHLLALTESLLHEGANEIGILTSGIPTHGTGPADLAKAITAVAAIAQPHDAIVKVILPTASLTSADQLRTACKISIDSGATMLQGGTWFDHHRASLSQMTLMRQAAGEQALLKWTAPITSLDRLLLACAEGIDRFNADTTTILKQAYERAHVTEIRIPEPGDY